MPVAERQDMLNENRIYLMIRLADFRQENQDKDLRVVRSYKRDYIAMALVKNFVITTITWLIFFAIYAVNHVEFILANLSDIRFGSFSAALLITYLMMLAVYSLITYAMARIRYERAKNHVREYSRELDLLDQLNGNSPEEKDA